MKHSRIAMLIGLLIAAGALAAAQKPPLSATPPSPPSSPSELELQLRDLSAIDVQNSFDTVRDKLNALKLDIDGGTVFTKQAIDALHLALDQQGAPGSLYFPTPDGTSEHIPLRPQMSEDQLYSIGQSALDRARWDQALEAFGKAAKLKGSRADGSLYWQAYSLAKLGRLEEALQSLALLRGTFSNSRWLDDAKALELELKLEPLLWQNEAKALELKRKLEPLVSLPPADSSIRLLDELTAIQKGLNDASRQHIAYETDSNDDLKLLAINSLMQSDPDRAVSLLEKQLKGSASPRVKRNALFVLAQSKSPKAQALIEQIARGHSNPDLQAKAVLLMAERSRPTNDKLLAEIYTAASDSAVKSAVIMSWFSQKSTDRLLDTLKTEKSPQLRNMIIAYLGAIPGTPELWQLYASTTDPEVKRELLRHMYNSANSEKLQEVFRTEKDPLLQIEALRVLGRQPNGFKTTEWLVNTYRQSQEARIRQAVLDVLFEQGNAKTLVALARSEPDPKSKLHIVERLSRMKSKDASDYMEEILANK